MRADQLDLLAMALSKLAQALSKLAQAFDAAIGAVLDHTSPRSMAARAEPAPGSRLCRR